MWLFRHQSEFPLVPNQSEKCIYNQNLVWFNRIQNWLLCVCESPCTDSIYTPFWVGRNFRPLCQGIAGFGRLCSDMEEWWLLWAMLCHVIKFNVYKFNELINDVMISLMLEINANEYMNAVILSLTL